MKNISEEEIIFLFGAGISIPIGIPAMAGIYRSFMSKTKSELPEAHKKMCNFFVDEMGVEADLEEFLLASNRIIEFRNSGLNRFVESSISKVKSSGKVKDFNKNLKLNLEIVEAVKDSILDFLAITCFKFDRVKAEKINSGFVSSIAKLGYSVYSTNYDSAFEHVARENNIDVLDNFIKVGQRTIWNDNINFDGKEGFKLIKLHGSVTWYEDAQHSVEKIDYRTSINPLGVEVKNITIVPTRFKDIYSQNFFALYSHFLVSLSKAKLIVIAGHSLRDDYLRAAIIERKRQGDFRIIVVDPNYPTIIKKDLPPARQATNGDIIHLPYKWEDISDELSCILLNSPASNIGKDCITVLKQRKNKNKLKFTAGFRKISPGDIKEIAVETQAYLSQNEKPSNLRVWLKAIVKSSDGTTKFRVSNEFIEIKELVFGDELTGMVNSENSMKLKIPLIEGWLNSQAEVSLVVALIKSNVKKPSLVGRSNIIILDSRKVPYKA